MSFRRFDAGVVARGPRGDRNDCQVRALTTARGMRYQDAWALLYKIQGQRQACSFTLVECLRENDERFGVIRPIPFPAKRGMQRMNGAIFCRLFREGRFILRLAQHVVAVKDGVLFDVFDSTRACVYVAWEVSQAVGRGVSRSERLSKPEFAWLWLRIATRRG